MELPEFIPGPPAWIEWNGQRWYRMSASRDGQPRGHYRNPGGDLLHRVVWEYVNGPIPPGGVIHHGDEDKANNDPGNLHLLTDAAEHAREHPGKWEHPAWVEQATSDASRERARRLWDSRQARPVACDECGNEFMSTGMRARFCGQNCRARNRRHRLKAAALS